MQSNFDNARVLAACVHNSRGVSTTHMLSFGNLCSEGADLIRTGRLAIHVQEDAQIDLARSRFALTAAAHEHEFTHMFQFDADMSVSLDDINALLSRNVDVVSGTYFKRVSEEDGREFVCVASRSGMHIARTEIREYAERDELIPVHGVGGGCLLVRTEVLRAIGQPAFKFDFHVGGSGAYRHGEDSYFSDMVRHFGYKVWMDPCVIPWHLSEVKIGMDVIDRNGHTLYTPNY